jgi:hypothetical protein
MKISEYDGWKHVALTGAMRNAYTSLVRKHEERDKFGDLGANGRMKLV